MKRIWLLIVAFVSLVGFANAAENAKNWVSYGIIFDSSIGNVSDGKLEVNTMERSAEWSPVWCTPAGSLRAGKSYRISLNCTAVPGGNGAVFFLVRRLGVENNSSDLVAELQGAGTTEQQQWLVDIPGDFSDYSFQVHAFKDVEAEISDLRIDEILPRNVEIKIPDGNSPELTDISLPEGAKEFMVEQPKNQEDALFLNGADFGFSSTLPDNSEAWRKAFFACREQKAAGLRLASGIYRFRSTEPLMMENLKNFTLDGNGATLEFSSLVGSTEPGYLRQGGDAHIVIRNCERLLVKNLKIEWDWKHQPLASFVKVSALDPEREWAEFEFVDYQEFPNRTLRVAEIGALDPETGTYGAEKHKEALFEFIVHREKPARTLWTAPNRIKVWRTEEYQKHFFQNLQVGEMHRMRHFSYDTSSFLLQNNRHLTMCDVSIYSSPGFGILLLDNQQYLEFNRVNTTVPVGSGRPISCASDNFHSSQSQGYIKFLNSDFGFSGDDCINFTDANGIAVLQSDGTLKLENCGIPAVGEKFELRLDNFAPTGIVITVTGSDSFRREIKIAERLDGKFSAGTRFVIFNQRYDTRNIIIRNCHFHDNRGHGVVASVRDVTLEDNLFSHTSCGAIKLETGYNQRFWGEGYGVSNVVVRNNVFNHVNVIGVSIENIIRDIGINLYSIPASAEPHYPLMHDIVFQDNTFLDPAGAVLYATCAKNIFFLNNTIRVDRTRENPVYYRGAIVLNQVQNCVVANNVWEKSKLISPRIIVCREYLESFRNGGNQVTESTPAE